MAYWICIYLYKQKGVDYDLVLHISNNHIGYVGTQSSNNSTQHNTSENMFDILHYHLANIPCYLCYYWSYQCAVCTTRSGMVENQTFISKMVEQWILKLY